MQTTTLFNAKTGTGDSDTANIPTVSKGRDEAIVQIDVAATATVEVYGRISARLGWILITTITSSQLVPLVRLQAMYLKITASTGLVNAELAF